MNDNIDENIVDTKEAVNDELSDDVDDKITEISDENTSETVMPESDDADNQSGDISGHIVSENESIEITAVSDEEPVLDEKLIDGLNKRIKKAYYSFDRLPREKRKKYVTVAVVCFVVVMLIFTDLIPILPNAYNRFYVGNSQTIGETQAAVFDNLGDNVIYAAGGRLMIFGPDMSCKLNAEAPTGTPMIETDGDNAIVYYENLSKALIITNKDNAKTIDVKETIKAASITSGGYYGIVRYEPGYESCVEVFAKGGSLIYKWHTNNPIIDISVSDNGKYMVASGYEIKSGSVSGKVMFFDLSVDKPLKELVLNSNIVPEVKFLDNSTAVVFGDKYTCAYSPKGSQLWRIEYNSRVPKSYDIAPNGDIAYIFDRYTSSLSESTVEIYNKNGTRQGVYNCKENVRYISCNNNYVLLSLDRQTILLDDDADVVKIKNTSKDFKKAVLYKNYNFAFSITDGTAEIMSVKH